MTGAAAGAATVSVRVTGAPIPPALLALMVMVVTPATVGVPVMTPVEVFAESPAGRHGVYL